MSLDALAAPVPNGFTDDLPIGGGFGTVFNSNELANAVAKAVLSLAGFDTIRIRQLRRGLGTDVTAEPARGTAVFLTALVAHIGGDERNPVETNRSQFNSRRVWIPHRDAYTHTLGGQAVYQSAAEETRTAEYHNRGHHLLSHAGPSRSR